MRKTKIICTIGPASENEETLTKMCQAGMDVARLNFSHGSHEEHQKKIDLIKKVRKKLSLPIAIMLDTKGPEYRIKTFENGKIHLEEGATFTLTTEDIVGNEQRVAVNYKNTMDVIIIKDVVNFCDASVGRYGFGRWGHDVSYTQVKEFILGFLNGSANISISNQSYYLFVFDGYTYTQSALADQSNRFT